MSDSNDRQLERTPAKNPTPPPPGTGIRVTRELLLPLSVTGTFFAVGLLSLTLIPLVLWWIYPQLVSGAYMHDRVRFAVHLLALGWGTAVAMGAWQQLSVVVLQVRRMPRSAPAKASVVLFTTGLVVLLFGFLTGPVAGIPLGGTLLTLGFIAAIATAFHARTMAERASVMTLFVAGAFVSLVAVGVVGIVLGVNRQTGFLLTAHAAAFKLHVYLGPVGWFGMLIPGVSYELAPFFGITRSGRDAGRGRLATPVFIGIATGVALGVVSAWQHWRHPAVLLPLAIAYLMFVYDLRGIYKKRGAIRRTATLTAIRASHGWLGLVALLLLIAAVTGSLNVRFWSYRWDMAVAWIAGLGWITHAVSGYLHRILPFLLWHHRNWGAAKDDIKTLFADMVDQKLGRVGIWIANVGVAIGAVGMWFSWMLLPSIALLAIGLWIQAFNMARAYGR